LKVSFFFRVHAKPRSREERYIVAIRDLPDLKSTGGRFLARVKVKGERLKGEAVSNT
jgi:hypothetical protein